MLLETSHAKAIHLNNYNSTMKYAGTPAVLKGICATPQLFMQKEPAEQNSTRKLQAHY